MNIIMGSGPQALYVLRSLSKVGSKAKLVALDKKIAFFSKYGYEKIALSDQDMVEYFSNPVDEIDRVFICGGKELQLIIDSMPSLYERFDVYPKPIDAIRIFSDKIATYNFFSNYAIEHPKYYTYSELKNFEQLPNPIIVKWNQEVLQPNLVTFKTKVIRDVSELHVFLSNIDVSIIPYLIIQDFIEGDDSNNVSLQLAFGKNVVEGELYSVKKRVSKNGFTSHIVECDMSTEFKNDIYTPVVRAFLDLKYEGLAEAEFKFCDRRRKYYLIEVNPRPCGLISSFEGKFLNMGEYLTGGSLNPKSPNNKVRWSNIARDSQIIINSSIKSRSISCFFSDSYSLISSNTFDVFDIKDLKPFFYQFISRVKN